MKNILYLAYACEPNAGSEYGVGWNIPILFATKYSDYNVYVLTRSRCKEKIQEELHRLNLSNLNFFSMIYQNGCFTTKKWVVIGVNKLIIYFGNC